MTQGRVCESCDVAIALTRDAIAARAIQYRRLVIALVVTCLPTLVYAVAWREWRATAVLILVPGAVLLFCATDALVVQRWRKAIMAGWGAGFLQLDLVVRTLRRVPGLPDRTLDAMLATLPSPRDAEIPSPVRLELAHIQALIDRSACEQMISRAVWPAFAVAVVFIATAANCPLVLLGLIAPPLLALSVKRRHRQRVQGMAVLLAQACRKSGVDPNVGSVLMASLDWQGLS